MAIYRQIHTSFWQDDFVLGLTPEEKYFYLYLLTNSKTKQCGIYEISKKVMVLETGYNLETVDKLVGKFVKYKKILYDPKTKEICLMNWKKYNPDRSPKIKKCVDKELLSVKNREFVKIYDDFNDTLSRKREGVSQQEQEEEQEEEQEREKEEIAKVPFADDSLEMKITQYLYSKIKENDPKAKEPDFQKWAYQIDLLMRNDGREKEEIGRVINWSQQDTFWKTNILSTKKLRDKYPTLKLQMETKGNGNSNGKSKHSFDRKKYPTLNQDQATSATNI